MKISYKWLREYVNTKVCPESIASQLTMAGHEVVLAEERPGDTVFDIEVTPNRPDCLSHIGIAREITAVTGKRLKPVHISPLKAQGHAKALKIVRENKAACPLYTMRVLNNAQAAPSPKWLMNKLCSIGLNPINNIVDITNFVLFETGHPLHAFDLDKIAGNEIIIRNAISGESILTVDNIERKLKPQMLVIADKSGPIAIAGIMGGKNSSITDTTKNIILESAYFDPVSIRRASFALDLSTDSSYRFERGADLCNVAFSSHRAASLMCGLAKARAGVFSSSGNMVCHFPSIALRTSYLNKILGTSLKPAEIRQILLRLGYKIKGSPIMHVVAPSYRSDTKREADLIEEVARVHGYDKIKPVPAVIITTHQDNAAKAFMSKRSLARTTLVSSGFSEAISYSLISKTLIQNILWADDDCVRIKNPLSKEQEIMRPSLLPGVIRAAAYNISRQVYDIKLFELSNVYFKHAKEYKEELYLALAVFEKAHSVDVKGMPEQGLFRLKGAIANLAETLDVKDIVFDKTASSVFSPDCSVAVFSGNKMLGSMGRLKNELACDFNITGFLFAAEINFTQLVLSAHPQRRYKPLPRFPYTYRDISFAVDTCIEYKEIESLIKRTGGKLVEEIELLSQYRGKQIEEDKKSLAMRITFRCKDKTLSQEEIVVIDTAIRKGLVETFNAVLR
jgi:phenylalanyl-tRNA synthetase beta chain